MDHQSLVRPSLPGSTPAAVQGGKSSVYATNVPARLEQRSGKLRSLETSPDRVTGTNAAATTTRTTTINPFETRRTVRSPSTRELIRSTSAKQRQRVLQEKTLTKIVAKLPYELRETVTAVLTMAFSTSEHIQKDLDVSNQEAAVLKSELAKKIAEVNTLAKSIDNYKSRIKTLEENVDTLKDNIDARQKFSLKNRSAMTRLATTNRMLIDALDALQANHGAHPLTKTLSGTQSTLDEAPPPGRIGQLAPLPQTLGHKPAPTHDEYEEKMKTLANSQNEKLRESLLKIAREHYRSMKNIEHLEGKVAELKLSLRAQEQVNRNLKTELDELKTIHLADAQEFEDNKASMDASNINFRDKSFGLIDDRFKAMIQRNLFDPIDGIQQLRRILAHMATAPTTLSLTEMISHIVSRDALRIFDAEMICLYLVRPGSENVIHRFTTRSSVPCSFDMNATKSLAAETIRSGKVMRANNLAKFSSFNAEIDGSSGVLAKRILSLPLINARHNVVIGALEFINKGANNDVFAEIDEIFGLIFAYQTSLLLTSCVMYDALFYHSQLLRGLLEASTELYNIIPEPVSLAHAKSLSLGEILIAVERTAKDLLKSPNVRAFLVSDTLHAQHRLPPGEIVFVAAPLGAHRSGVNYYKAGANVPLRNAAQNAGIVGRVLATREAYLSQQDELDSLWNPTVDLDPLQQSMLTLPLVELDGTVLGALQLVVGSRSPRLKQTEDPNDFRLFFGQAAEWLCHQLAAPLKYLLDYVGRPAQRPVSTPSRMTRASADGSHRPSFFASSEEVVSQVIAIDGDAEGETDDAPYRQPPRRVGMREREAQSGAVAADEQFESFQAIPLREIDSSSAHEAFSFPANESSPPGNKTLPKKDLSPTNEDPQTENSVPYDSKRVRFTDARAAEVSKRESTRVAELEVLLDQQQHTAAQLSQENQSLQEKLRALETASKEAGVSQIAAQQEKAVLEHELQELAAQSALQTESLREEKVALERMVGEKERQIDELSHECAAMRERASRQLDREIQLEKEIATLRSEMEHLRSEHTNAAHTQSSLQDSVHELSAQNEQQSAEIARLLLVVQSLEQKIVEKDRTQAILQEQVLKLANQQMENFSQAVSTKTGATPTKAVAKDDYEVIFVAPVPEESVAADFEHVQLPLSDNQNDEEKHHTQHETVTLHEEADETRLKNASESPPFLVEKEHTPNEQVENIRLSSAEANDTTAIEPSQPQVAVEVGTPSRRSPPASARPLQDNVPGLTLPAGWIEMRDDYGRVYYYHEETGTSSWTLPDAAPPSVLRSHGDWDQFLDDSGTEYWLNRVTGESSWTLPEDADKLVLGSHEDVDEEDLASKQRRERASLEMDLYHSSTSQFSISAGDYTIEL